MTKYTKSPFSGKTESKKGGFYDWKKKDRQMQLVLEMIGYVSRWEFHNAAMRKGFTYLPESDCFALLLLY